jgi:hypothetical protein
MIVIIIKIKEIKLRKEGRNKRTVHFSIALLVIVLYRQNYQ